ncbi:uncharacterized protein BT62DRAFT_737417 [Guyanagaster necrorhizus]|uniref:Kinesin motor domain-containing protein n=1 Tax=Guyanagaster necrorhizus TaxID=856835 RepID=A0A9P7VF37_9AGAR|nr:uncharacterized protein BT62DRAFT_737417 [Guyanagaster necrorhizus MCA 3950]KAG7439403.1 hypothetical protein BT62DRAFT_737417 [Guyanagaster necrorhizus MCA 3950]
MDVSNVDPEAVLVDSETLEADVSVEMDEAWLRTMLTMGSEIRSWSLSGMYFLGVSVDIKPDPVLVYDLRMQTRHGFRRQAPVLSMSILSMQSLALRTLRRTNLTLTLYSLAHRTNLFTAPSLNRMCMPPWKDTTLSSLHTDRPPPREEVVMSLKGVKDVLKRGESHRRTACTDWDERSSRSHSVFRLVIESREGGEALDE